MSTKMKKTELTYVKKFIKNQDEKLALAKAMISLNAKVEEIETAHEEDKFMFKLKTELQSKTAVPADESLFTVEKDNNYTLPVAKQLAMDHFNTFEGNIKIVDQDETHIVFSKVRG